MTSAEKTIKIKKKRRLSLQRSKYHYAYIKEGSPKDSYDSLREDILSSTFDSNFIACNPIFFAFPNKNESIGVYSHSEKGRIIKKPRIFRAHKKPVLDLCCSPFDFQILASSSEDKTIKLWRLPKDGILKGDITKEIQLLQGHKKKLGVINFHNTAANVLCSSSVDRSMKLWDVERGKDFITLDLGKGNPTSFDFDKYGKTIVVTCQDKKIRLLDVRDKNPIKMELATHGQSRGLRCVYLRDKDMFLSTGFSNTGMKEAKLYDTKMGQEIQSVVLDSSTGINMPFYDNDLGLLYLAGKGESTISYFHTENRFLNKIHVYEDKSVTTKGICMMPKISLNTMDVEIGRFLKLTSNEVKPLRVLLPRLGNTFQKDLFPDTYGWEPVLSSREFFDGGDLYELKKVSLAPKKRPKGVGGSQKQTIVRKKNVALPDSKKEKKITYEDMKKKELIKIIVQMKIQREEEKKYVKTMEDQYKGNIVIQEFAEKIKAKKEGKLKDPDFNEEEEIQKMLKQYQYLRLENEELKRNNKKKDQLIEDNNSKLSKYFNTVSHLALKIPSIDEELKKEIDETVEGVNLKTSKELEEKIEEELKKPDPEFEKLKVKMENFEKQKKKDDIEYKKMKEEYETQKKEIRRLEIVIEKLEKRENLNPKELDEEKEKEINLKDMKINQLEKESSEWKSEREKFVKVIKNLKKRIKKTEEVEDKKDNIDELEKVKDEKKKALKLIKTLKKRILEKEKEKKHTDSLLVSLNSEKKKLEEEIGNLKNQNQEFQILREEKQISLGNELERELNTANEEIKKLKNEKKKYKALAAKFKENVKVLSLDADSAKKNNDEIEILNKEISSQNNLINDLKEEIEKLKIFVKEKEQRVVILESESIKKKKKISELEKIKEKQVVDSFSKKTEDLQKELENSKNKVSELKNKISKTIKKNEKEVEELKSKISILEDNASKEKKPKSEEINPKEIQKLNKQVEVLKKNLFTIVSWNKSMLKNLKFIQKDESKKKDAKLKKLVVRYESDMVKIEQINIKKK